MGSPQPTTCDFARLHRDVVFGRSGGRIIWQPIIGCWYRDKQFSGEPLPEPYRGMSVPDIHRALGCADRNYCFGSCFKRVEDPGVRVSKRQVNDTDEETVVETPS